MCFSMKSHCSIGVTQSGKEVVGGKCGCVYAYVLRHNVRIVCSVWASRHILQCWSCLLQWPAAPEGLGAVYGDQVILAVLL